MSEQRNRGAPETSSPGDDQRPEPRATGGVGIAFLLAAIVVGIVVVGWLFVSGDGDGAESGTTATIEAPDDGGTAPAGDGDGASDADPQTGTGGATGN